MSDTKGGGREQAAYQVLVAKEEKLGKVVERHAANGCAKAGEVKGNGRRGLAGREERSRGSNEYCIPANPRAVRLKGISIVASWSGKPGLSADSLP